MAINLAGYLYSDNGSEIGGATVKLIDSGGNEEASYTTTSVGTEDQSDSTKGKWVFSETDEDVYDIEITQGSQVRRIKGADKIQLSEIDVRNNTAAATPAFTFTNTYNSTSNQVGRFRSLNTTRADNDEIYLSFELADSGGTVDEFARITAVATDVTAGEEDGALVFSVADTDNSGNLQEAFRISSSTGGTVSQTFTSDSITFGSGADTDIVLNFNANTSDGVITWMEDEDYFKFSDEILMNSTEKLLFGDTGTFIHQSSDGVLTITSDTTVDINGAVVFDGVLTGGTWQGTAIASGYIANDAITGAKIADDAIDSEHYTDGSIDTAHLAADVVTGAKIADDAIGSEHIADDAITSALIADDAITTALIADDAITSALIADDAVVTAAIADNAITNALMADDAIDSAEIADGAVDLAHMSSEAVDEDNLYISNSGSNGQFLSKQSGNNGGLTWATPSGVTVTDSTSNTNFPVVFHDESNGLLDDTGALRYNPSTGQLLVPNLTVAGTTTTVDTVTMNAENAVVFEGATADGYETTLSVVDPTADHTQYLINQGGYIPLLAASTTTAISATPAEINLIDGGTARGTTAVASGDGILINDGGTMRMTNVDTVSTYFSSHNVGGSNIVTTGDLNAGAITSGFGNINNGSSTITTTGAADLGGTTVDSLTSTGDFTTTGQATDWDLVDDNGSALSFDASGKTGILELDTTDSSEQVKMSGGLNVTGTATLATVDIGAGAIDGVTLGTNSAITNAVIDDVAINGKVITMTGSSSDTAVFTAGTHGTLSIVTTDDAAAAANIQITADGTVDIDSAGVLTLDSGAAINLEPASGSAVLIDGTVSIDGGAITGVASILQADVKIGEDDQTKVDFETADEIHFYAANVHQVKLVDNAFTPQADSDVDLGASGTYWKDAFIDTITTTGDVDVLGNIELGHASDTTLARSAGGTVTIEGDVITTAGVMDMWIPAGAMRAASTNGCADITDVETTATRPDMQVLDFDSSTQEYAQFSIAMPKSWNEGTVTAQFYWTHATAVSTDVIWGIQGVCVSDNDTIDIAYGTAQTVTDTFHNAAEDLAISAATSAITLAGSPAEGDLAFFQVYRDADAAGDTTNSTDARLVGVKLMFTTNAANDA